MGTTHEQDEPVEIVILTVIPIELEAARRVLQVDSGPRDKDLGGTIYYHGAVRSERARRSYAVALTCIGGPGNPAAAAATARAIAKYRPRAVVLMGIAAGVRGKVKIGEVVLSERVVAYEPAALIESGKETEQQPRPEIERAPHTILQDLASYGRPQPARLEDAFRRAGGVIPAAPAGREAEFDAHVASGIDAHQGTIASGEKLLRDPRKLLQLRELHGKVEAAEMEAAGVVDGCRAGTVPWLIIRGISDFGDGLKDDRFHAFASCAAAAVLYDFIAHGLDLDISPLPAVSSQASIDPPSVGRHLDGSSSVQQPSRRPVLSSPNQPRGTTLRILHISDFHGRSLHGPQAERARLEARRRDKVLGDAWVRNLEDLQQDGVPFDLVVFTGDLGDWGDPSDYDEGVAFLRDTCKRLRVPLKQLFLVPGNHDVNRQHATESWKLMRELSEEKPEAVSRWLAGAAAPRGVSDATRDAVLERTLAFWKAVDHDLGRGELLPARSPHKRLGYRVRLELQVPVHIIGFDSAWLAGDGADAGRLLITEDQVNLLASDDRGRALDGFRLALVHHPLSELHAADTAPLEICDRVDLLLRGHQHAAISRTLVNPDRRLHELAAGCLYEGDRGNHYPNGCQVIDVALGAAGEASAAHVRFRSWSPHGHWHDDSSLYRAARQGRLTIPLAEAPDPDRSDQAASDTATSERRRDGAPPDRAVVGFKSLFGPGGVRPESATSLPLFRELVEGIERRWSFRIREFLNEYIEAPFGGRDAEWKELDEWLCEQATRLGMIVAGAGCGKSALLVRWTRHVAETGRADVVFMPISLRFETARANDAARAIAGRLVHLLPPSRNAVPPDDPSDVLQECKEMFRTLWSGVRPLLVVIDGLDEAIDWRCDQLIPQVAGDNVKLLVAARRISTDHTDWEDKLGWRDCRQFSLRPLTPQSVAEIVRSASEFRSVAEDTSLMVRFHALTEGDPLIIHLQLILLRQGKQGSPVERMERLLRESSLAGEPLQRYFDRWWREQQDQWGPPRAGESHRFQAVFDLLACAKGPLGLADLRALTGADPEALRQTLEQLGRFVIVDRTAGRYVFSHSRLHQYFAQKLLEAGDGPQLRRRFVEHGDVCFAELEVASTIERRDEFDRRFGYVIRHYALHLKETSPGNLIKLVSRPWLEGWRALEGEDGVYGGFSEDMNRVEARAREAQLTGEHVRALLVKGSITSLSSNVPPLLMHRLVEAKLWPLSRALRLIDRLVDENERASALGVLAGAVEEFEQHEVLKRAMALPRGYRSQAMAWMISDLAEPLKVLALEELLVEGIILQPHSLLGLEDVVSSLSSDSISKLIGIAHSLPDPEQRAYVLLAIVKWAPVLPPEERRSVLEHCRASTSAIGDASRRAHYLCEMAATTECAPTTRELLLQSAWDVVRTLKSDQERDAAAGCLTILLDHLDVMASATQREVTDTIWDLIETSEQGWLALSRFGRGLARHGFISRVLERYNAVIRNEHSRCMLLGSLLPHGGDFTDQIADRLQRSNLRNSALGEMATGLSLLPPTRREECLAEVFDLVSRRPRHAHLLGTIASRLMPGDPNAPRLLAAVRRLDDPAERSERLAACVHLASDEERVFLVEEILRDAEAITKRDSKKRLLTRLVHAIKTNDKLLRSALAVSRRIGDAGFLAYAVEQVAVLLAEAGHADEASALAGRATATFTQHPQWGVETYVSVSRSLSRSSGNDDLWNRAVQLADALPAGTMRAALLASLARPAPAQLKQQHLAIVGEAIDALADTFQKTYARIRLLDGLETDRRQSAIALVVANLTEVMSQPETLTLTRELLAQLSPTERELHRATLNAIVAGFLQPRAQLVASAQESVDDRELLDEETCVAELAPFLDGDLARDAIARTPAESVSNLEALALRMASLGHHHAALEAVRKIESPDARSGGLARLLEHLPSTMHVGIIEEARRDLAIQGDRRQSAETESLIVPYLHESERGASIRTALAQVCSMESGEQRRETMRRLAGGAVRWLSSRDLENAWMAILERIAKQRRQELVVDLIALNPMLLQIGGPDSIRMIGETLLDVAEWFP